MIAHLVRKYTPPRVKKRVECPQCGEQTVTEAHQVLYCLVCGQALWVPSRQDQDAA